ncbi:MAG: hypothetical protein ACPGRZ_11325 [Alphaproteobacteria bacterium]
MIPDPAKSRNHFLFSGLTALLILGGASSTAAMPVNGGFESGSLAGWTSVGDVGVATSAFGTGPATGTYQALLTTRSADQGAEPEPPIFATNAVTVGTLEAFTSRPAGSLSALSIAIGGTESAI